MILTADEVEKRISKVKGTWVKRSNARKRLKDASNNKVRNEITLIRNQIRLLRANGAKEQELRRYYAKVTRLELQILE